ncbi:hypothetical protein CG398_02885, partial [Bifidobacteriaceae bacterium NR003]
MTLEKICVNIFLVLWLKDSIWIKVMHKSTIWEITRNLPQKRHKLLLTAEQFWSLTVKIRIYIR